jgi:hypothetical protein
MSGSTGAGHIVGTLMYGQTDIGWCQGRAWFGFRAGGVAVTGAIPGYRVSGDAGINFFFVMIKAPPARGFCIDG